jgi:hypothetical protein
VGQGVNLSRPLCWFIKRVAMGILPDTYWLTCWSAKCFPGRFGACIWWHRSPPVFQCNMEWRSFVQAGGSGCLRFDSSWCFFSAKGGSSISAKFLICGAHSVCFCTLVSILDPPEN